MSASANRLAEHDSSSVVDAEKNENSTVNLVPLHAASGSGCRGLPVHCSGLLGLRVSLFLLSFSSFPSSSI